MFNFACPIGHAITNLSPCSEKFITKPLSVEYLSFPTLAMDNYLHFASIICRIPVSEIFGGLLAIDLIYDPTQSQLSSLSVQLNYYYENIRNNVFEFTMNVHGK